eukprot:sb/3462880/
MLKATEAPLEPPKKVPRLSDFPFVPPPPDEVILYIFSYLDSPTLSTCRYVCKTWHKLSEATLQLRKSTVVSNDENVAEFQNTSPRFPDYTNKVIIEGKPSLHHLPREMILHIFTFLEPTDLLKCGQVCKLWYNISRRSLRPFFRRVYCYNHLQKKQTRPLLVLPQGEVICRTEYGINIIESFADILEDVVLDPRPTRSVFEALGKCTNLKSVDIDSIDIKDHLDLFHTISLSLPKILDSLTLTEIDQDTMLLLLSNMCYLRQLTLNINGSFKNKKRFAKILKRLQLRSLDIFYDDVDRLETDFLMTILHALSGTLEQLSVSGGVEHAIDFDSLPFLHNLKSLAVHVRKFGDLIIEESCEKLLSNMPNLVELEFDKSFEKIGDCIRRCLKENSIRKIILHGKSEYQSLMNMLRCYSGSLEELKVPIASFVMEYGSIPEFPKLTKCSVYYTDDCVFGDDASMIKSIRSIFESMPNIVDLSLQDMPLLPLKCLHDLVEHCPKLKTLELPQLFPPTNALQDIRQLSGVRTLKTGCIGKNVAVIGSYKSIQNLVLASELVEDRDVALLIYCLKYLKDLDITRCEKVTGVFIELISGLKRHSPTLTIHCPDTVNVRRESIPKQRSTKLFERCDAVTPKLIIPICEREQNGAL